MTSKRSSPEHGSIVKEKRAHVAIPSSKHPVSHCILCNGAPAARSDIPSDSYRGLWEIEIPGFTYLRRRQKWGQVKVSSFAARTASNCNPCYMYLVKTRYNGTCYADTRHSELNPATQASCATTPETSTRVTRMRGKERSTGLEERLKGVCVEDSPSVLPFEPSSQGRRPYLTISCAPGSHIIESVCSSRGTRTIFAGFELMIYGPTLRLRTAVWQCIRSSGGSREL